jgi:hypothetical protein
LTEHENLVDGTDDIIISVQQSNVIFGLLATSYNFYNPIYEHRPEKYTQAHKNMILTRENEDFF